MIGIVTYGLGGDHTVLMLGPYRLHIPTSYVPPDPPPAGGGNSGGPIGVRPLPVEVERVEHIRSRKFVFTIGCQYWVMDSEYVVIDQDQPNINITPVAPTNPFTISLG